MKNIILATYCIAVLACLKKVDNFISLLFLMNDYDRFLIIVFRKIIIKCCHHCLRIMTRYDSSIRDWRSTVDHLIFTLKLEDCRLCDTVVNEPLIRCVRCGSKRNHPSVFKLPQSFDSMLLLIVRVFIDEEIVLIKDDHIVLRTLLIKIVD